MTIAAVHNVVLPADVLIHEAGHAVIAWELGVRVGHIVVDRAERQGHMAFASDTSIGRFAPRSRSHRLAAERDMLVYHAGFMAQRRFHYDSVRGWYPLHDYQAILEIAEQFTADTALIDAWSAYIEERARHMLEHPATWARVLALAVELARRAAPDGTTDIHGEAIEQFLAKVRIPRTNAFLAHRRRQATGIYVALEYDDVRERFSRAIDRMYRKRDTVILPRRRA